MRNDKHLLQCVIDAVITDFGQRIEEFGTGCSIQPGKRQAGD